LYGLGFDAAPDDLAVLHADAPGDIKMHALRPDGL
jgi:hypothetical protein